MQAKHLRALLDQVSDEVDIFVNIDGYDVEVGGFYFNDQQGYIALAPIEDEAEMESEDYADECGDQGGAPACNMREIDPPSNDKVKVL
jgi:hypothetical protein